MIQRYRSIPRYLLLALSLLSATAAAQKRKPQPRPADTTQQAPADTTQQAPPVDEPPPPPAPEETPKPPAPPPPKAELPLPPETEPPPEKQVSKQPSQSWTFGAPIKLGPSWTFGWGGYLHVAYRWIEEPKNYNLAGRNNGFQLQQARLVSDLLYRDIIRIRISLEGASEDRVTQSFPGGTLTARLRDAYVTWAPLRALRVSVGQMVTPSDLESMRTDASLPFVSRSVAVEGVQPSEGLVTLGMGTDRTLGISLHSGFIPLGTPRLTARYALLLGNGNGPNQRLNANNLPALFGRADITLWTEKGPHPDFIGPIYAVTDPYLQLPVFNIGFAAQYRPRTEGNLPDLIRETDTGFSADVMFAMYGIDVQAGLLYLKTVHDTLANTPDLERFGWWAHLRFTIPVIPVAITPGYRIASYAPRAHLSGMTPAPMDAALDDELSLLYHTLGLTVRPTRTFPIRMTLSYTITTERGRNVLDNNRFEADIVAVFP